MATLELNDLGAWQKHLRKLARPALKGSMILKPPRLEVREPELARVRGELTVFIDVFSAATGAWSAVARPMLAHHFYFESGPMPEGLPVFARVWWKWFHKGVAPGFDVEGAGALFDGVSYAGVSGVDAELCALHGASWEGMQGRSRVMLARALSAARHWMERGVEGATLPWALHVFVSLGMDGAAPAGERERAIGVARRLLELAGTKGPADPFAAFILLDSAEWLDVSGRLEWKGREPVPLIPHAPVGGGI